MLAWLPDGFEKEKFTREFAGFGDTIKSLIEPFFMSSTMLISDSITSKKKSIYSLMAE